MLDAVHRDAQLQVCERGMLFDSCKGLRDVVRRCVCREGLDRCVRVGLKYDLLDRG